MSLQWPSSRPILTSLSESAVELEEGDLERRSSVVSSSLRSFSKKSENKIVETLLKSYTDMPVSQAVIGVLESLDLMEARKQLTLKLVLFNKLHRPLSTTLVNNLLELLGYFTDDYETFKILLDSVKADVIEAEKRALLLCDMYVQLAADLKEIGMDAERSLKAAQLEVETRQKDAKTCARIASGLKYGAVALAVTGIGGGCLWAGILIETSAAPAAIEAAFASCIEAGFAAAATAAFGNVINRESVMMQIVTEQLMATIKFYEEDFVTVTHEFADCVKGCAEIFNGIHTTLDLVDRKLKKMQLDLADEALRALYKQVQREADTLREACGSFNKSSVGLNVDITLLETFEKENYWSYIDDWYNNFSSANKGTPFIRKFLEKAIPQLSVPSLR